MMEIIIGLLVLCAVIPLIYLIVYALLLLVILLQWLITEALPVLLGLAFLIILAFCIGRAILHH
jgi:hypothetical protein